MIGVGLVSFFGPNDEQAEESLTFAAVLRDSAKAVPNEDVDSIMDRLDALADAL